jgi:hypothetical protein
MRAASAAAQNGRSRARFLAALPACAPLRGGARDTDAQPSDGIALEGGPPDKGERQPKSTISACSCLPRTWTKRSTGPSCADRSSAVQHGDKLPRRYSRGLTSSLTNRRHPGKEAMRRLILKMSMSLDGFVCGPNGELDWIFRSFDDELTAWQVEALWQAGVHAMGSRTFRDMANHWPTSSEPHATPMNENPEGRLLEARLGGSQEHHEHHAGAGRRSARGCRARFEARGSVSPRRDLERGAGDDR